jgi:hypothetical protein
MPTAMLSPQDHEPQFIPRAKLRLQLYGPHPTPTATACEFSRQDSTMYRHPHFTLNESKKYTYVINPTEQTHLREANSRSVCQETLHLEHERS